MYTNLFMVLHCDHINLPLSSPRTQLYPKKKPQLNSVETDPLLRGCFETQILRRKPSSTLKNPGRRSSPTLLSATAPIPLRIAQTQTPFTYPPIRRHYRRIRQSPTQEPHKHNHGPHERQEERNPTQIQLREETDPESQPLSDQELDHIMRCRTLPRSTMRQRIGSPCGGRRRHARRQAGQSAHIGHCMSRMQAKEAGTTPRLHFVSQKPPEYAVASLRRGLSPGHADQSSPCAFKPCVTEAHCSGSLLVSSLVHVRMRLPARPGLDHILLGPRLRALQMM